jgi:adenine-specific DNA-methyltransferase
LAAHGQIKEVPKTRYFYDPHLPPVLRFDETGKEDRLPELLEEARHRPLTDEEARLLRDELRNHEPWLEWAGKREKEWFDVDPVALHIHERVSAQAILKLAAREPVQRDMFADPELEYREAVRFYEHDVDWTNRLILGDSLTVMHSLARREDLAGKVQMIYIDPPYGIKYGGNFQPQIHDREVKGREVDLTREPEMVRAYRDTWTLGVHSYLAYLRDRLVVARGLLSDLGSIFIQISDVNVHHVRELADEVFGCGNFVSLISYKTTQSAGSSTLDTSCDYLIWYAKNLPSIKFRSLFKKLTRGEKGATRYDYVEDPATGETRHLTQEEQEDESFIPQGWRLWTDQGLTSRGRGSEATMAPIAFQGGRHTPTAGHWRTTAEKIEARVIPAERVVKAGQTIRFKKYFDDFGYLGLTNLWDDVGGGIQSRKDPKVYVVQTSTSVIQRCMLMTTDPGDLVLDPTCGGGTTAYVAEQWGRRWISIDTSRVAIALARQRVLTAEYEYYEITPSGETPGDGFIYHTVPHVELGECISGNPALDPIFARWEPMLAEKLDALNRALKSVTPELRARLATKLADKEKRDGRRAITDGDRRRWLLPKKKWEQWEAPFDADPGWTKPLMESLLEYRKAWRQKMDEVTACIQASAPQEELVDQPKVVPGVIRVSGPFTVEGVQPAEETLEESPITGEAEEMQTFGAEAKQEPVNAEAYLEKMIRLLRQDGVRFPDNKVLRFERLEPMAGSLLHAEGQWGNGAGAGGLRNVGVSIGPQYGPVTAVQVEECLREASRRGFDDLVLAGFTFDGAAQAAIQEDPHPKVRCHLAHIRPDVNMGDLLKDTPSNQLFTVFGLPRVRLERTKEGEWLVEMEGVDIYDPIGNTIQATRADKVAAWFLDGDYDGRTFCITQAFFPDRDAWEKLAKALKTVVDPERFEAFSGTKSLPFPVGEHKRAAVKVIDPRGNEVMRVIRLEGGG